jgi:hypothetical protein
MHCHARERFDVDVAMMNRMDKLVQRPIVQETMSHVEAGWFANTFLGQCVEKVLLAEGVWQFKMFPHRAGI